ncbi:s1 p1 nuclease [Cystoisospora suis]|uniref:S1 p1 nuclease n=1 Tax=Cystoisospora suis TaxID=483139 RepID=A0A2C6LGD7_9APIC|nr:s1 p1 nuclease [Cystoisospora suis]
MEATGHPFKGFRGGLHGPPRSLRRHPAKGCGSSLLAESSYLCFFLLVCVALVFQQGITSVTAWWSLPHVLTGAIARSQIPRHVAQKIDYILSLWQGQYPSMSTLERVGPWLDSVACSEPSPHCQFNRQDAMSLFRHMHYTTFPYNPQGIDLHPLDALEPIPQRNLTWLLKESFKALKLTTPNTKMLEDPHCKFTPRPSLHGLFASVSPGVGVSRAVTGHQTSSGARGHAARAGDVRLSQGTSDPEDDDDDASTVASSSYEGDESSGADSSAPGDRQGFQKWRGRKRKRNRRARRKQRGLSRGRDASQGGTEVGSTLSLNLHMRLLLHLYGDLHNPLHNITAFTEAFPRGDRGGNLVTVRLPNGRQLSLHALWDGCAGRFEAQPAAMTDTEIAQLASQLMRKYPLETFKSRMTGELEGTNFFNIALEGSRIARQLAYREMDWGQFTPDDVDDYLPYEPSEAYLKEMVRVCEQQVVLGGYRLAQVLNEIGPSLPPVPEDH